MKRRPLSIVALLLALCLALASCTGSSQPAQSGGEESGASQAEEASTGEGEGEPDPVPVPEAPSGESDYPVPPPPAVSLPIDKGVDETTTAVEDLPELDKAEPVSFEAVPGSGPVYIFLTRHGETITNVTSRAVSGQGSSPLTESGREVARQLGLGLQDTYFKAVYSSTLNRTYETASIILAENQTASRYYPIQQREGMRELDMGNLESYRNAELGEMGVDLVMAKYMADDAHALDPTAENYQQFVNRTWAAINEIGHAESANGGGNVLVVAHSIANASIARNLSYPDARSVLKNSSIVLLKYEDGQLELLSFNDMSWVDKGREMLENPQPVELNLVVTAETREDTRGRLNNVLDNDLTDAGVAAAQALGASIAPEGFRAVYASDLWKEVNTAEALIAGSGNPWLVVHSTRDLRGVQAGIYEGELWERLPESGPTARERITAYHENDAKEVAEDYAAATGHVLPAYRGICEETYITGGGKIAVVASELTHQLVIEELTGTAVEEPLRPGDVVTLLYDGSGYRLTA